jgi:hypothetical protein
LEIKKQLQLMKQMPQNLIGDKLMSSSNDEEEKEQEEYGACPEIGFLNLSHT